MELSFSPSTTSQLVRFPPFFQVNLDYIQISETVFNRKKQGSMRDLHHIPTVQGMEMLYHQLRL